MHRFEGSDAESPKAVTDAILSLVMSEDGGGNTIDEDVCTGWAAYLIARHASEMGFHTLAARLYATLADKVRDCLGSE